jgi:hypothetical protein
MNTRVVLTSVLALAAAAVAPAVIGRYGDELAGFLRADALLGFGVVATLVALITMEYGRKATRTVRQSVALCTVSDADVLVPATKIVTLPKDDNRAAA